MPRPVRPRGSAGNRDPKSRIPKPVAEQASTLQCKAKSGILLFDTKSFANKLDDCYESHQSSSNGNVFRSKGRALHRHDDGLSGARDGLRSVGS